MYPLSTPLSTITYITKSILPKLKILDIETVGDLLFHFPSRYEDLSQISKINEICDGFSYTITGTVSKIKTTRTWHRKMTITEALLEDETGSVKIVWFNQPYIETSLNAGKEIRISGKATVDQKGFVFQSPVWELKNRRPTHTGRIVPIYPETKGITSRWIRWKIQEILTKKQIKIVDPISEKILNKINLPTLSKAIQYIHFPKTKDEYLVGQKRFAFEEMLLLQIKALSVKKLYDDQKSVSIAFNEKLIKDFVGSLPFQLTGAQKKAAWQILQDLEKSQPMNRLLNGDVGSGKTIVAAIAALQTVKAGFQVAILAPTEVLARQHFETFSKLLDGHNLSVALLTGTYQCTNKKNFWDENIKSPKKLKLLSELKNGKINLLIGTHTLIQNDIKFKNLATIIIDEQHRFGVAQRAYLQQKSAEINDYIKPAAGHGASGQHKIPHLLSMTATPIPRTLTLSFFGNLDISILDEMPKNRKTIITKNIDAKEKNKVYQFIRSEIKKGRQAFVILPLVEESDAMKEVKAATTEHKRLQEEIFPDLNIGLLHGKMKSKEKEDFMKKFKNKEFDILVATAVIEVGIDVPNATVMIIEDADRFGLAQLHQFRGRVGRSEHQSYCFLFSNKHSQRLKILENNSDGFSLAEKDLALRGPGEFLGTKQSGLPDVSMESLSNIRLIKISREEAKNILESDPSLINHPLLKERLDVFEKEIHLE